MTPFAALPAHPTGLAIDTHAHVFTRDLPMADGRRYTPDHDARLADYLGHLNRHGLSHGVLIQPSFLGTDNSHMLDAIAQSGGRLRGVAVVDPYISAQHLEDMHAAGVRGIRLNLFGRDTPPLREPLWQGLLTQVNRLGWHVELHIPARRLHEAIPPLIAAQCRIVVDHFGRPDPTPRLGDPGFAYLLSQAPYEGLWVKLSAAYRLWPEQDVVSLGREAIHELLAVFSPNRLMWGSDWPHTEHRAHANYTSTHNALLALVDDAAIRHTIFADTPSALFGIEGDTP